MSISSESAEQMTSMILKTGDVCLRVTGTAAKEVVALLADKDLLQAWDTINTTNTFYNADKLTTNYFAHKHGIMAGCKFANAIAFVKGATIA